MQNKLSLGWPKYRLIWDNLLKPEYCLYIFTNSIFLYNKFADFVLYQYFIVLPNIINALTKFLFLHLVTI